MRVVRRASCAAVRDVGREGCGRVTTLYVVCCVLLIFFFLGGTVVLVSVYRVTVGNGWTKV
jgi:hypothetical protein